MTADLAVSPRVNFFQRSCTPLIAAAGAGGALSAAVTGGAGKYSKHGRLVSDTGLWGKITPRRRSTGVHRMAEPVCGWGVRWGVPGLTPRAERQLLSHGEIGVCPRAGTPPSPNSDSRE